MNTLFMIVALVIGFIFLVKGSDYFVEGSAGIARRLGIPQIVIGLTIVAMGTSTPEAAVSIEAAIAKDADLSIGNVVGSNILNILLILGISALICNLSIRKNTMKYEIPFMVLVSVMLLLMGVDGQVGIIDGVILLFAFGLYLKYLIACAMLAKKTQDKNEKKEKNLGILLAWIILGLAAVLLGSRLVVYGACELAEDIDVSERVVGLTIVALGTSLAELVTSVVAARKNNPDIAIGNIVGSNIFNILFILGVSSIIQPIRYGTDFMIDSGVMIFAGVLLFLCVTREQLLKKNAGIWMLICYGIYLAYLIIGVN